MNRIDRIVLSWGQRLKNKLKSQGLPKFPYLNGYDVRVKNGGDVITIFNAYYDPELGTYMYWANVGSTKFVVPEKNIEEI